MVPGAQLPVPDEGKDELCEEYKATIEALKILTSRPSWVQRILTVFRRLDGETFPEVDR